MTRTTPAKRVVLALPVGIPHIESHVRGILDYAAAHGRWTIGMSPESPVISIASLRGYPGDGVIAFLNTRADAQRLLKLGIPAVDLSGALERSGVPRVSVDNGAVGLLGANHLLECGFRRFGYYGVRKLWYSKQRGAAFRQRVESAGGDCSVLLVPHTASRRAAWTEVDEPLRQWLQSLRPPVGVFTCGDYRARMVIDACGRLGLRVPDDVAVLGVSNDLIACEYGDPPLSSVSRSAERVGHEAAALLDRLMKGRKAPKGDILIPPDGVVRRRSTDAVAIDDAEVAAVVRYMRDHLTERIPLDDIARRHGISRRWLHQAFRKTLGHSPHAYLNFLRVRRAQQLLVDRPKLPLRRVAQACGFSDAKRLRQAFARFVGVGPREYRG
jgi:LacI family transcriptional regulator